MLEGSLEDFTLSEILQLLAFTRKSGRLELEVAGTTGRIDLTDGLIRDASADTARLGFARRLLGLGLLDGEMILDLLHGRDRLPTDRELAHESVLRVGVEADTIAEVLREQVVDGVFDLLRRTEGSFRFAPGAMVVEGPPELACTIEEVVADADARLATWTEIERRTGSGDSVVTITRGTREGAPVALDGEAWSVVAFVDGRRTIDELVRLTGRGQFHTRRVLSELVEQGIVTIGTASGPGTVEGLLATHHALAELEASMSPQPTAQGTEPAEAAASVPEVPMPEASAPEAPEPETSREPAPEPETSQVAAPEPALGTTFTFSTRGSEPFASMESVQGPGAEGDTTHPPPPPARRLGTDPAIDEEFVGRLIDGVEDL